LCCHENSVVCVHAVHVMMVLSCSCPVEYSTGQEHDNILYIIYCDAVIQVLWVMLGLGCRRSCRIWCKKYDILTVPSLYIPLLPMFLINNFSYFQSNLSVHSINTRPKSLQHKALINLSSIQKDTMYSAINVSNKLPLYIKELQHDNVQFKNALNHNLLVHTL
jgi:hypothetical protein